MKKKYSSAFAKKSDTEVLGCTADFMQWSTFLSSGMPRSFQREMLEIYQEVSLFRKILWLMYVYKEKKKKTPFRCK